ncbi:putative transcriptional regulators, CopG/Arc/MetJ family [Methanohalobium evestigatum Z-7303]|jgi:Arc/MetJ-type ribon-helix-helix transcriptional regulator|uniref:Putative transcriptional regulators, CopG/Arc/MetJ family n=1 Tax=Methanohalobium evestigatum (strain ATCC BAA-1072 / DSM 3721 / NBRC 107634 / OCM 161 / Z-7303) TaxID=644295 RepID=D7E6U3_METEZ|nr:ribbon-helix-helix domain-containing protein [Methanohalobium evestigatum]ADI73567.1 putative transcriptional regulators, CopG/Arc/MetJ family [Methanohalobium evestigatum Z-7303]
MSETTICTRFPNGTVKEIDELVENNYYKNRSDVVRSLVRTCLMINKRSEMDKEENEEGGDCDAGCNHDKQPAAV